MTETVQPPADRPALNPFHIPGWEGSPLRPLCPWNVPGHEDFYVNVDNTQQAFDEFTRQMSDIARLHADGRLVLVTGESGCGKTALINRCAFWLRAKLHSDKTKGVIIDLTRECDSGPRRSTEQRMSLVCTRLLAKVKREKLLPDDVLKDLASDRNWPDLIYPSLSDYLGDAVVLIILLPPTDDVVDEVISYASLTRGKLLFFAEAAYLDDTQVWQVEHSQDGRTPPIVLRVGALNPGDVRSFASDRLKRHAEAGEYPQMSTETMDQAVNPLLSVATLQTILFGVYEERRVRALRYTESDWVTFEDITNFVYKEFLKKPRTRR